MQIPLPVCLSICMAPTSISRADGLPATPANFGEDVAFLKKNTDAIVLRRGDAAAVLAPAYQGRVMTTTATGDGSTSYGWVNYKLIAKGVVPPEEAKGTLESKIHVFGGEERFWLGPEGGQFGIFFAPGAK